MRSHSGAHRPSVAEAEGGRRHWAATPRAEKNNEQMRRENCKNSVRTRTADGHRFWRVAVFLQGAWGKVGIHVSYPSISLHSSLPYLTILCDKSSAVLNHRTVCLEGA